MKIGWLARIGLNLKRRKELAEEGFDLSQFVNQHSIEIINEPFPHVVIDNFFKNDFFEELRKYHQECLHFGLFKPLEEYGGSFKADVFSPRPDANRVLDVFFHLHGTIILQKFLNSLPIR